MNAQQRYYRKNKQKWKEYGARLRATPERQQYLDLWRSEHPDYYRELRRESPERRESMRRASLSWYYRNRQRARDRQMRADYGVGLEVYEAMVLEQKGLCAICERPPRGRHGSGAAAVLHLDHDAETGTVRRLLCKECNMGLGLLDHDPALLERAATYLRQFQQT